MSTATNIRSAQLLLVPFAALFVLFVLVPLAWSMWLSLQRGAGAAPSEFGGLANYRFVAQDRGFWLAAANTTAYAVVLLALQVPLCLAIAVGLRSGHARLRDAVRFALLCPYFVGPVFASLLFVALLDTRHGLFNRALGTQVPFLTDPRLSLASMVLVSLWLSVGFGSLYLAAAMQVIPRAMYDAAKVDGAGAWGCFWHITLPSIRPMLAFLIVIGTIQAFQLFELPYVLFGGPGPSSAGMTLVMYLYGVGFEAGNFAYASAVGWMIVLILSALLLVQYGLVKRLVH